MEIDPSKYDILLVGPRISRLKPFFTQRAYRADAIQGGQEGLEALQSKLYHLVVLELNLEDIEPADFIDHALRTQPNAAYMLMDDPAKSGMIVSTFVRGIDVYVPIPPDEDALFVQVGRHVLAASARGGGRSEAEQYETELKNARASLETAGAQVRRLRDENETAVGELAVARAALDEAEEKLTQQLQPMRAEVTALRLEVARLKTELESERAASGPLRAEIEDLREKSDMLSIIEAENEDLKNRLTRALQRPATPTAATSAGVTGGASALLAGMRPATSTPPRPALQTSVSALALGEDEEVSILDDDEGTGIIEDDAALLASGDDDGEVILDDEGTLNIDAGALAAKPAPSVAAVLQEPDELILDEDDEHSTQVKPGIALSAQAPLRLGGGSLLDDDENSTQVKPGISPASELSRPLGVIDDDGDSSTLVKAGISVAASEADILADALASFDDDAIADDGLASSESTSTGVTAPGLRIGIDALLHGDGDVSDEHTINLAPRLETRDHPVRVDAPPTVAPQSASLAFNEETRVGADSPASEPFEIPLGMESMISELVDDSTRDIAIPDEIQALGKAQNGRREAPMPDVSDDGMPLDEFDLQSIEGGALPVGPASASILDDDDATRNIPLPESILSAASRGDAMAGAVLDHVGAASRPGAADEVTRLANPTESSISALAASELDFGDETAAVVLASLGPPAAGPDDAGFDDQTMAMMVPSAASDLHAANDFGDFDFPSTQNTGEGPAPALVDDDGIGIEDPLTSAVPIPKRDAIAELASATVMRRAPIGPPPTTRTRVPERGLALGEDEDEVRSVVRDERSLKKVVGGRPSAVVEEIDIDFDE